MDKYRQQIEEMIKNIKEEENRREVTFKQGQKLIVNGQEIPVSVLDIKEPMEKDDEKTNINKMHILFKTKDGYILIAEVTEDKEIVFHSDGLRQAGIKIELKSSNKIELTEEEREEDKQEAEGKKTLPEEKEREEEPEEEEPKKEEPEQDDKKPQLNQKQSNWIKLDLNAEVVHNTPLRHLIPNSDKYKEVYIVPGKDEYSYTIQGGDKESGYEVIESLERTEGRGPTQDIISIGNSGELNVESKQALAMYKIRGREDEGFSITEIQPGNEQVRMEYWRKAYGDMYISTTVPQANADRGLDRPSPEVKYLMAKNQTSRLEMERIFETYEKADNLKKQDVPFEANPAADGIELEELDRETLRQRLIEEITQKLKEEYGENQTPGFYDNDKGPIKGKAVIIADKILDDGQSYEKAKEETFDDGRGEGGQTPDQKRNREG
ncbi:MAG: hypothetical protein IJB90_03210 [Clostridia bacterium]|nr:hypothetical protein [Clostridia bacterium]